MTQHLIFDVFFMPLCLDACQTTLRQQCGVTAPIVDDEFTKDFVFCHDACLDLSSGASAKSKDISMSASGLIGKEGRQSGAQFGQDQFSSNPNICDRLFSDGKPVLTESPSQTEEQTNFSSFQEASPDHAMDTGWRETALGISEGIGKTALVIGTVYLATMFFFPSLVFSS